MASLNYLKSDRFFHVFHGSLYYLGVSQYPRKADPCHPPRNRPRAMVGPRDAGAADARAPPPPSSVHALHRAHRPEQGTSLAVRCRGAYPHCRPDPDRDHGSGLGHAPRVELRARRSGIDQDLVWLGHVEDPAAYRAVFRRATAFTFPSEWEAFGLVLLEAMAAGVPISRHRRRRRARGARRRTGRSARPVPATRTRWRWRYEKCWAHRTGPRRSSPPAVGGWRTTPGIGLSTPIWRCTGNSPVYRRLSRAVSQLVGDAPERASRARRAGTQRPSGPEQSASGSCSLLTPLHLRRVPPEYREASLEVRPRRGERQPKVPGPQMAEGIPGGRDQAPLEQFAGGGVSRHRPREPREGIECPRRRNAPQPRYPIELLDDELRRAWNSVRIAAVASWTASRPASTAAWAGVDGHATMW